MSNTQSNLLSINWLEQNLQNPDLIILDATIKKSPSGELIEQPEKFIPGAQIFNFDTEVCDQNSSLPHMLCSTEAFELKAQQLAINNNSKIVIYDAMGIFSSPRAWWMFKIMGVDNVYVLDGGLPKWLERQYPTQPSPSEFQQLGNFQAKFRTEQIISAEQILSSLGKGSLQIIDARSRDRFSGTVDEPRTGLHRGHIPDSSCLPFSELIENGFFKNKTTLENIFQSYKESAGQLVFSCGSGVTACILALAATEAGIENWSIYDGSWSEWGLLSNNFPIATS